MLRSYKPVQILLMLVVLTFGQQAVLAGELRIAVASNFSPVMKVLASQFERDTGHRVIVSAGSTGKHYSQIMNGAPFDIFFAADSARPKLLESSERGIKDTRFTYAIGRLVLWSPAPGYVGDNTSIVGQKKFRFLAIANPKLAPYGYAAKQVMEKKGIWQENRSRIVTGENIAQAYKFVESGNAQLGFIAYSQLLGITDFERSKLPKKHFLIINPSLYDPIEQQAILLKNTTESGLFIEFIKSKVAREIIRRYGYDMPS